MITPQTLSFLKDLAANNHKDWFHANKDRYQTARQNFIELTQQLIDGLGEIDSAIADAELDAKKSIMRINRDIRFSKDKTPYKTNFFTFMSKGGKKSPFAGYYLHIAPGDTSFIGGGIYMPDNKVLAKIRQEIDYQLDEWKAVVQHPDLRTHFGEVKPSGELKRAPKGYDEDHPAIDYLKYKGYYTQKMLSDEVVCQPDFVAQTLSAYQAVKPLVDFINRSLD